MTKARDLANLISGGFTEADIPNLSASKITSGTFSDSRISASSVSQHAQSFDDNKIVNDISTLGLRVHTQENLNASNTNSASFDVFQDSSGITNLTNATRNSNEYVNSETSVSGTLDSNVELLIHSDSTNGNTSFTDSSSNNFTISNTNVQHSTAQKKFGATSLYFNGSNAHLSLPNDNNLALGTTWTIDFWVWLNSNSGLQSFFGESDHVVEQINVQLNGAEVTYDGISSGAIAQHGLSASQWHHIAFTCNGGTTYFWRDGARQGSGKTLSHWNTNIRGLDIGWETYSANNYFGGYMDEFRVSKGVDRTQDSSDGLFANGGTSFTPPTQTYPLPTLSLQSTGSFEGNPITASSTNKMGAVITYQDNAGTNALNTDIILKLSADNGSNYSTATLTALPDFATGIKMCKVNDLSVTSGNQLKYKIEFANQASGSKEARIRGVSLQY